VTVVMATGVDYMGRTVVVFIGRLLPASTYPVQKVCIVVWPCICHLHMYAYNWTYLLAGGGAATCFVCNQTNIHRIESN